MTKLRQGIFEKRKYYENGDVNEGRGNTLAVWGKEEGDLFQKCVL